MHRIRVIDIAFLLAALAFAIATAARAQSEPPTPTGAESATAATVVVQEDIIHGVVKSFVLEQLAAEADLDPDVRREINVRWQGDILLENPGIVEYQVRKLSNRPFRGPSVTRVEIVVDGELVRTIAVTVDCRLYRDIVVAARTLRRGEMLMADGAVDLEERDITQLRNGFYADFQDLEMLQTSRPIGAGDIVTHRHAEPVPVIHRGDQIVVQVTSTHMALETVGEAMQDGGIGEQIRVRNADSGKVLRGEILEAGLVRVRGL